MSHIIFRKLTGNRYHFAGRDWWYEFGHEFQRCDKEVLRKYVSRKQTAFAKLTKNWNDALNTEWLCRVYFSAKMIMTASVTLQSLDYARKVNLKVCVPYLQYYSVLYSLRSLLLMLPEHDWQSGKLVEQKHSKTINVSCSEIDKINPQWNCVLEKDTIRQKILALKAFREMISYRAPSSGGSIGEYDSDVIPICKVPVELAQMISELLEDSLRKHAPESYQPQLLTESLEKVYRTEIDDATFYDKEDEYRIGYLSRKHPFPTNILHIMSEGHVEDFFDSWCSKNGGESDFDPDNNCRILFDMP